MAQKHGPILSELENELMSTEASEASLSCFILCLQAISLLWLNQTN